MKYFLKVNLCLLCWFVCTALAANTFVIDSLEQVLATSKLKNQEKAELLIKLSQAYMRVDTAKCRAYAMETIKLAKKSGLKLAEASAYNTLGVLYNQNTLPYQAHVHYIKAEEIYRELDKRDRLFIIYYNMMAMFWRINDYENASYYAIKAETMAKERNDWLKMTLLTQMVLGEARFSDNNDQEALDYFLNLYQKALHIEDSLGLNREISSMAGGRCGTIYTHMNRPYEALPYFYQTLEFSVKMGSKPNIGIAYANLAKTYALMHNIDSTEYYISKTMDSHITTTYYLYRVRSKVDSLKGNYLSALANYQKYHHLNDSLSKEDKSTEMARLKLWHEFDQKEIEKRILQQEFQKQRKLTMILAIALVMILALLALAVFFYMKIIENNRKLNEKNHEITEKNCELEELHTVKDKLFSVVAHDLRNPIAVLMSVLKLTHMKMLDAETQAQMLKDVSRQVDDVHGLLDNLLCWAKSQMKGIVVSPVYFDVQNEIHTVMDSLLDIAAAKKIVLNNRMGKHEIYADRDMFSIVMRNLATNALKYTSTGGEVTIDSELSDNMLIISVKDTGTGMTQEVQKKLFSLSETRSRRGTNNEGGTGLGLVLCADFVKANGGRIWFTSVQGKGSTFFFSVPMKS